MSEPGNRTNKTVSVFAAHPDDIEIGMAGTICRLADSGNQIHCFASIADDRALRIREAQEAARILGIKAGITKLFNDGRDHSHRHAGRASCRGKSRR